MKIIAPYRHFVSRGRYTTFLAPTILQQTFFSNISLMSPQIGTEAASEVGGAQTPTVLEPMELPWSLLNLKYTQYNIKEVPIP
jgi:hypothetical protein